MFLWNTFSGVFCWCCCDGAILSNQIDSIVFQSNFKIFSDTKVAVVIVVAVVVVVIVVAVAVAIVVVAVVFITLVDVMVIGCVGSRQQQIVVVVKHYTVVVAFGKWKRPRFKIGKNMKKETNKHVKQ